jgi:hypothetical protein
MNPNPTYGKDYPHFVEWQECQKALGAFDAAILDIRKYGFTFLTLLLTADGFLVGRVEVSNVGALAIYAVLLLLIFALFRIDRMHEVFLRSAVLRAMDLEKELHLGVSSYVSYWSESARTATWGLFIYILFCGASFVLGTAALVDGQKETPPEAPQQSTALEASVQALLADPNVRVVVVSSGAQSNQSGQDDGSDVLDEEWDFLNAEWPGFKFKYYLSFGMLLVAIGALVVYDVMTRLKTTRVPKAASGNPFSEHIERIESRYAKQPNRNNNG